MEDQARRLEGPGKEPGIKSRGESENPRKWTVMVMGPIGRIRSFKISPRLVFWCFLFLIIYFASSILIIHRWTALERVASEQERLINLELEPSLREARRDLFKAGQRVALLKRHIESLEKERVKELTAAANERREPAPPQPERASPPPAPPEEADGMEETPRMEPRSGVVDVEEMEIDRGEGTLRVHFNLKNIEEGPDPVSGYVHIIANGCPGGSSWHKVYPRGEVKDNFPSDYRAGQPFIIQRFKPILGRFEFTPGEGPACGVRVVVYNEEGTLVYDSSFGMESES